MKKYLRDHPTKIIPSSLINPLHCAMFTDESGDKARPDNELSLAVFTVCRQLELEQAHILGRLLMLLDKVRRHEKVTKMNAECLGTVFAPTLCDTTSKDAAMVMKSSRLASNITTILIEKTPLLSEWLHSLQAPNAFRVLGYPPKTTEKENSLYTLHTTGKSYGKGQTIIKQGTGDVASYYRFESEVLCFQVI